MIKIIDPTTKEILVLEHITADLQGNLDTALGKNPCSRSYRCDEDEQRIWPITFSLNMKGYADIDKEGRVRVTASATYTATKEGGIGATGGSHMMLTRESTAEKMGGYVLHNRIAQMIRDNEERFLAPARTALVAAITRIEKTEAQASSAHAARARVAKMTATQVKGK